MTPTPSHPSADASARADDPAVAGLLGEQRLTAQRAVRAVLGASPDEEDLVQEVLTRLVIRLRQPGEIAVGAWTWSVAHNVAVDHVRARRPIPVDAATLDRGVGAGLDDHAISGELAAAISVGLSRLPERQRDALVARAGLDGDRGGHALVAATLGVSPKAAESILARARQSMRRELERIGHAGPWAVVGLVLRALGRLARRKTAVAAGAALIAAVTVATTAVLVYSAVGPRPAPPGPRRSPARTTGDTAVGRPPSATTAAGDPGTGPRPGAPDVASPFLGLPGGLDPLPGLRADVPTLVPPSVHAAVRLPAPDLPTVTIPVPTQPASASVTEATLPTPSTPVTVSLPTLPG